MERVNFIKLLEEYRNKAINELYKEFKVQAALLITDDFKAAMMELEKACKLVYDGLEKASNEVMEVSKRNSLTGYVSYFRYNLPSTSIVESAIENLAQKIRNSNENMKRADEIRHKFNVAINAAKASRSAARLKELADSLGIETPSIEVSKSATAASVDVEFVKEKIKSVLQLTA
jgi:hypothetical protein